MNRLFLTFVMLSVIAACEPVPDQEAASRPHVEACIAANHKVPQGSGFSLSMDVSCEPAFACNIIPETMYSGKAEYSIICNKMQRPAAQRNTPKLEGRNYACDIIEQQSGANAQIDMNCRLTSEGVINGNVVWNSLSEAGEHHYSVTFEVK